MTSSAVNRARSVAYVAQRPLVAADFTAEIAAVESRLMTAAASGIEPADRDRLRADSNSLVVRAAQAALTATKGAGYVTGHPVERLVRESLFFLVWSWNTRDNSLIAYYPVRH